MRMLVYLLTPPLFYFLAALPISALLYVVWGFFGTAPAFWLIYVGVLVPILFIFEGWAACATWHARWRSPHRFKDL
jgi:hypothetical protein